MQLTKNEKKTLKLLLNNSRISDSEIANQLRISSQAVGKIRRKLENTVIKKYGVELDYPKLGINTFAIGIGKMTTEGLHLGGLEVEEKLNSIPHIISVYRIPRGNATHLLTYGFEGLEELDEFFHSGSVREEIHKFVEIQELFTCSHNSLIKNSPDQLFKKVIDSTGTKNKLKKFSELEKFKRKIVL